jgi:hypothetical protein
MPRKRNTAEQIITKLRQAEAELSVKRTHLEQHAQVPRTVMIAWWTGILNTALTVLPLVTCPR